MKEILALLAAAESEESAKKFDVACGRFLSCQLAPPGQRKRCGGFSRHYPELWTILTILDSEICPLSCKNPLPRRSMRPFAPGSTPLW